MAASRWGFSGSPTISKRAQESDPFTNVGWTVEQGHALGVGVPAPSGPSPGDELLATVDVVGRAGERFIAHEVHGEGGEVGGPDHAADGQRGTQLLAPVLEVIAEE